jgi:mannose-1-phosphate guanylyltransferase
LPASTSSSATPDAHLWITILAGGSGTRFWPLSTPGRPKQLLPLASEQPLIKDTLDRARGITEDHRIRILTGAHLLAPFREALEEISPEQYMVEPQAKGTGPVLVWAAWALLQKDPDAVLASLHADHAIEPWSAFQALIRRGAELARDSRQLFTIAVPPDRPEVGYGYIRPGDALPTPEGVEAFSVKSFVEKPDREAAEGYLKAGYLWNSGIFLWRADTFLDEVRVHAPELARHIPLLEAGDLKGFFEAVPSISVDEAVLEKSQRVASIRATFQWDDVGSWEALSRTFPSDASGNVSVGSTHLLEAKENIVVAEEGDVVLFGVENLVVVRRGDVILVADRNRAPDLKTLLKTLSPKLRDPEAS